MHQLKRFYNPIGLYVGLTAAFFCLVALLPASQEVMANYDLSARQYHILLFLVELPLAAIWFAAFYSYGRLRNYARAIAQTPEGQGFSALAVGGRWLALGLVIPTIISLTANGIANRHPSFHSTAIIVSNYLNVVFPLLAFGAIARGSHALTLMQRTRPSLSSIRLMMVAFIMLGVGYCLFTFQHLDLHDASTTLNPYFLPLWLVMPTLMVPYLYTWFIGLFAAQELSVLAQHVKGVLYRQSLRLLAVGVSLVVAGSIGQQYFRAITPRVGHLSLSAVLVTTYLIYVVIVGGFILMSLGAYRLKRIEDI